MIISPFDFFCNSFYDSFFLIFLLTRFKCRSNAPPDINSASAYCSSVGTEQEKLPILRSYSSISDLGSIIYPILIELDRLFEKVLMYITESRASRE